MGVLSSEQKDRIVDLLQGDGFDEGLEMEAEIMDSLTREWVINFLCDAIQKEGTAL